MLLRFNFCLYYQFNLSEESSKACAFEFEGVVYRFLALPFGAASACYVVQESLGIIKKLTSLKYDVWTSLYIDDYLQAVDKRVIFNNYDFEDKIGQELKAHGVKLNTSKKEYGTRIEYEVGFMTKF